jgi:hypothetical protein
MVYLPAHLSVMKPHLQMVPCWKIDLTPKSGARMLFAKWCGRTDGKESAFYNYF